MKKILLILLSLVVLGGMAWIFVLGMQVSQRTQDQISQIAKDGTIISYGQVRENYQAAPARVGADLTDVEIKRKDWPGSVLVTDRLKIMVPSYDATKIMFQAPGPVELISDGQRHLLSSKLEGMLDTTVSGVPEHFSLVASSDNPPSKIDIDIDMGQKQILVKTFQIEVADTMLSIQGTMRPDPQNMTSVDMDIVLQDPEKIEQIGLLDPNIIRWIKPYLSLFDLTETDDGKKIYTTKLHISGRSAMIGRTGIPFFRPIPWVWPSDATAIQ